MKKINIAGAGWILAVTFHFLNFKAFEYDLKNNYLTLSFNTLEELKIIKNKITNSMLGK